MNIVSFVSFHLQLSPSQSSYVQQPHLSLTIASVSNETEAGLRENSLGNSASQETAGYIWIVANLMGGRLQTPIVGAHWSPEQRVKCTQPKRGGNPNPTCLGVSPIEFNGSYI